MAVATKKWDPKVHPRVPGHHAHGGEFVSKDQVNDLLRDAFGSVKDAGHGAARRPAVAHGATAAPTINGRAIDTLARDTLRRHALARNLTVPKAATKDYLLTILAHDLRYSPAGSKAHAVAGAVGAAAAAAPGKATVAKAAKAVKAAAPKKPGPPPMDGLTLLNDRDLLDLAREFDVAGKHDSLPVSAEDRTKYIAGLRAKNAASPHLRTNTEKNRNDFDDYLFNLGRRKPANVEPFNDAAANLAGGMSAKDAAQQMRRAAVGDKKMSSEDLQTYRLLANEVSRKTKPRPDWLTDRGTVDLQKLMEGNRSGLVDLSVVTDPTIQSWVGGVHPPANDLNDALDKKPWASSYNQIVKDLRSDSTTKRRAILDLERQAVQIEFAKHRIQRKIDYWKTTHDRSQWAIDLYKPKARDLAQYNQADKAAAVYRTAAQTLRDTRVPTERKRSLGSTELGEVLPIDESRFAGVRFQNAISSRGEPLDPSFRHQGIFLFAAGAHRPSRNGLTPAENRALDHYTVGRLARALNGSLRKGKNVHGSVSFPEIGLTKDIDLDETRASIDSAIAHSTLNHDTALWRGVLLKKADRLRLVPGAILSDHGYSSTTVNEHDADKVIRNWKSAGLYKGTTAAKFKILAAAGTHAAVGHAGVTEALLGRDQKFRVIREDPPGKDGVPVFVLEAVKPDTDSGLVRGRDLADTFDYPAVVVKRSKLDPTGYRQAAQQAIYEQQGFDGKPKVVTKDELDLAVKRGAIEVFRGVKDHPQYGKASAFAEQYRTGDFNYGGGAAMYGAGTYTSSTPHTANSYAGRSTATPGKGAVSRMALRRDARVISYNDVSALQRKSLPSSLRRIDEEQRAELDKLDPTDTKKIQAVMDKYAARRTTSSARGQVISDLGNYAALLGYDAIVVPPNTLGNGRKGEAYYVVLNRTALMVQDKDV